MAAVPEATAILPEAKRTPTVEADIASGILAWAAKGERDPIVLKLAALSAVVDCMRYSHDISQDGGRCERARGVPVR